MGCPRQCCLIGLARTDVHLPIDLRRIDADYLKGVLLQQIDSEGGLARGGRTHQADHIGFVG